MVRCGTDGAAGVDFIGCDGGQFDGEDSTFGGFAGYGDVAVVFLEDFFDDSESESGAALAFAGDKDVEDFVDLIGWDTGAVVGDGDNGFMGLVVIGGFNGDDAAVGFDGVEGV